MLGCGHEGMDRIIGIVCCQDVGQGWQLSPSQRRQEEASMRVRGLC